jgi:hypothetical protein
VFLTRADTQSMTAGERRRTGVNETKLSPAPDYIQRYGKTVTTGAGPVRLAVPRDRNSSFEPKIVPKGQRRLSQVGGMILSLFARGMTTCHIQGHLAEVAVVVAATRYLHECGHGHAHAASSFTSSTSRPGPIGSRLGGLRPAGRRASDNPRPAIEGRASQAARIRELGDKIFDA